MAGTNKARDVKQSFNHAASAAKESARSAADTAQQGGRSAADAVRHGSDAAAEMARRGGEAGSEVFGRAGETAGKMTRRGAQAVVESQRQIAQDAAQRFEDVSRKVAKAAQATTENVRRLMVLPNGAEGGLRDMQQGVAGLVEGVVRTNLRIAQEMFRLANPAPLVELQQRFVREYTDTLLQNSAALVRAVRRTADETLRLLEQQIEQQRGEQRAGANENDLRFQTAAE